MAKGHLPLFAILFLLCMACPRGKDTAAADEDGDGYSSFDDCNDRDAAVHPGALEICDSLDNDCDGTSDPCTSWGTRTLSSADGYLSGETGGDYAGVGVDYIGDLNSDGLDDIIVGAFTATTDAGDTGAAYVVLGPVSGGVSLSSAQARLVGSDEGEYLGYDVGPAGDQDGDGLMDVLSGSYGTTCPGCIYLFSGTDLLVGGSFPTSRGEIILIADTEEDLLGESLDGGEDINGDEVPDIVAGAMRSDRSHTNAGSVFVLYGPVSAASTVGTADVVLTGEMERDYAGDPVSFIGDSNGDGLSDIVVGAYGADDRGSLSGAAYVVQGRSHGALDGEFDLAEADAVYLGESAGDCAGYAVTGAGDTNGDGYQDLVIGAFVNDAVATGTGSAYLLLGPLSGVHGLEEAPTRVQGVDGATSGYDDEGDYYTVDGDNVGKRVGPGGDLNGDGLADILVGGGSYHGVDVFLSPISGTVSVSDADGSIGEGALGLYSGPTADGDMDGDGFSDILVSDMWSNRLYLFRGGGW